MSRVSSNKYSEELQNNKVYYYRLLDVTPELHKMLNEKFVTLRNDCGQSPRRDQMAACQTGHRPWGKSS